MANALNSNSTLSLADGRNKTSTSISTNIVILVNDTPVGAVQELSVSEKRSIKQIDEIGFDGHIDSVPNQSTNISGSCRRVRFDRLRITEAFSRGFLHASSQVYPFDIVILDKQKRDVASQISTVLKNVWISGIDTNYSANDWVIVDSMQWEAESIFSVLNGGSSPFSGGVPAAQGGELGISFAQPMIMGDGIVNVERMSDVNAVGLRGSLSASGLIDLSNGSTLF